MQGNHALATLCQQHSDLLGWYNRHTVELRELRGQMGVVDVPYGFVQNDGCVVPSVPTRSS